MTSDLASDPERAIELCLASHERLADTARPLRDAQVSAPSRLKGWSIGHVLTHLARNAEGHARRLSAALVGEDVARYPGGVSQRDGEIQEGADRPASEIVADLSDSIRRLERVWSQSAGAGWPHAELLGDDGWPTSSSPVRRLREVEIHHVDLGLGYEISSWPEEYVRFELPGILAGVPERVKSAQDARVLLAWLTGRSKGGPAVELEPW